MASGDLTTLENVKTYLNLAAYQQASGTLTLSGVVSTNTCVVGGVTFTAGTDFAVGGTDSATATNLAIAINANATLKKILTASANAAVVTITAILSGEIGNQIVLTGSTHITATPMSGGSTPSVEITALDETRITRLITAASYEMKNLLSYDPVTYATSPEVMTFSRTANDNQEYYILGNYPNLAITKVELNDTELTLNAEEDGYTFDGTTVSLTDCEHEYVDVVEISATYGWATLPLDLEEAVIQMVLRYKLLPNHIDLRSRTVQDGSVVYLVDQQLPTVQAIVDRYRRYV